MKILSFEELVKLMTYEESTTIVVGGIARPIPIRNDVYEFVARDFQVDDPNVVGSIGSYNVKIDHGIGHVARMFCSERFVQLQHPDLVRETNEWMRRFFGLHLPIYVCGQTLFMNGKTLRRYIERLW